MSFSVTFESDSPITAQLISKDNEWPQPTILGAWSGETAGGHHKYDTFVNNPQYLMKIEKQTQMKILLVQEKFEDFDNIGFYVISTEENRKQKVAERSVATNKSLVAAHPVFEDPNISSCSVNLKPGSYVIIPTTFDQGQEASFKLLVMTNELIPAIKELADAATIQINGNWQGETAGGCLNDVRSWRQNVQYLLTVTADVDLKIKVKQTSSSGGTGELASVGFYVFTGGKRIIKPKKKNIFFKSRFVKSRDGVIEKLKLPVSPDPYILVPCTYLSDQEGAYTVQLYSDDTSFTQYVTLETLPQNRDLERLVAKGEWAGVTAGGCLDYSTWRNNPQFLLDVGKSTDITIFLTLKSDNEELTPGFYLVNAPTTTNLRVRLKPDEVIAKAAFRQGLEVTKTIRLEPGRYNIIPCTYKLGQEAKFEITVYSSEFGVVELKNIPAGILSMKGEWGEGSAGGCINDVKSWWNNPHYYLAVKQDVELVAVLIQNPGQEVDENNLLEIGMYITNSDGDGNPKTNEEKDLISKAAFSPDRDVVTTCTVPSSYWPYVITPCTFKPGFFGKFEIQLVMDESSLEYLELSKNNIVINPAEVVGAGEDPEMREIRKRFKPLGARCVELVQLTESSTTLPEYFKYIGRTLLQTVSQFQDSIVAWGENKEPDWWLEGYEEEYEEPASSAPAPPPPPPSGGPPPPPPPPKEPPINFSKPVRAKMVESDRTSAMTQEMMDELENKKNAFVDELLSAVKGGIKTLKKVEVPPKPIVEDPTVCAFNLEILNKRRAALEGLHDEEDAWSDEEWNDVEEK
uniref:Peptidase C2 calpain domain-containing protein n=1 Tax=Arcella intermedia TaxID=1963864 RepID=A0A6B2KY75_9EUKA